MIFTPKVRMEHGDRHWKVYPAESGGEPPEFECVEAKSTSVCLTNNVAVNMDKSDNCMPRSSKDHEDEPTIMWKRNSMQ